MQQFINKPTHLRYQHVKCKMLYIYYPINMFLNPIYDKSRVYTVLYNMAYIYDEDKHKAVKLCKVAKGQVKKSFS